MAKTISDLSDITDFVINKGNGVKGLSELGLKSIPNQYIQPLEERIGTMIMSQDSIPIIDMSNWNDPKVVESICSAAEKLGFFQLVNHGVPVEVLENVKEATHRFFLLPAEAKSKYSKERSPSNNVQYGTSFNPQAEKALEWKDFLGLYAYGDEHEASAFWPPVCRDEVLEYMKKSEILTKRLVELLMRRLNVKEIDKAKEYLLMGAKRIQLNYYPICPNPELAVGNGRHSDISTLTILLQDDIGGLYVRRNDNGNDKDGGWIHVPPVKGSLVINIGDALQIISNGRYKSVEHRVAVSSSKNRVSIPIFVFPRPSEMISPLPEVLESGEKPVYKSVLFSDYVKHFFAKPHNGKTTIEFAKI